MTRGEISKRLHINQETVRYYEKIGLITPNYLNNNYRDYNEQQFEKLELILSFKNFGFSLKEIKTFFNLISISTREPKRFNLYLTEKIDEIDNKIDALVQLKQSLTLFRDKKDKETCKKFSKYINSY
ncbi:MAG: MerR family transcriptional regulator [Spirochaetales bacterium]|nr:MerR family transcriptional regulator [Spirochaetales bacterium]